MSSSVPVFVVAEDAVRSTAGCRDKQLFEQLVQAGSNHLATPLAEKLSTWDLLNALVGRPPLRRALNNLLDGADHGSPDAWFYMNAYSAIIQHFSIAGFENWIQVARAGEWIERIHAALPSVGVSLDLNQLLFGGGLIELPAVDSADLATGYWPNTIVKSGKIEIDRYLQSDLCESDADPMRALNYPLHDVAEWLNTASQIADGAVVAFYY